MDEKEFRRKIIGSRIKTIRNNMGFTMKKFGQQFNPPASDSIVSRWERGVSEPNNERLKRIAELGNMSMFFLTTGKKTIVDLSPDEKKEAVKGLKEQFAKKTNDLKEQLKKDISNMQFDELDTTQTLYLANAFDYLRFSSEEDVMFMSSFLHTLNSFTDEETGDSPTYEEIDEFIQGVLKDIEDLLKKRIEK